MAPENDLSFWDEPEEGDLSFWDQPEESPSLLSSLQRVGEATLSRRRLNEASEELNAIAAERDRRAPLTSLIENLVGESGYEFLTTPIDELIDPQLHKQRLEERELDRQARAASARQVIEEESANLEELEADMGSAGRRTARVVGGVLSQPEQALPIIGGLAGGLVGQPAAGAALGSAPMAKTAFDAAYREAREDFGATEDEAAWYAEAMSAIEFGAEAVGGRIVSGLAGKLPGNAAKKALQDQLTKRIRGRLGRAVGGAVVEGLEEVATGEAQRGFRELAANSEAFSNPETRENLKIANAESARTALDDALDNFFGGALVGGTIAGTAGAVSHAYEAGRQQSEFISAVEKGLRGETEVRSSAEAVQRAQEETARSKEEAVSQAEVEQAETIDDQTKLDQMEADFRNQELRNRAAAEPDNVMAQRMAQGVVWTPERIREERESRLRNAEVAESEATVARERESIRKRQEAEAKKAEQAAARQRAVQERAQAAALKKRREELTREFLANNPEMSDREIGRLVADRMLSEPTPEVTVETPKPATPKKAAKPNPTPKSPEPAEEIPDDNDIRSTLRKAGFRVPDADPSLGMAAENTYDPADFDTKVKRMAKALTKNNSQQAVDFQNLVRQGKMVIAPNAEAVGRQSEDAAEYDIGTGKMYLYMDKTNPDDAVATVIRGAHEATHTGQFNGRDGRPSILRQIMGNDRYDRANQIVRQAAQNGNKIAQAAVRQAEQAAQNATGRIDPATVETLEVMPYFVGEAAKARKGFGVLGGIVRDLKAGARNMLRAAGVDMDVDINDLDSAAKQVMGEIVQTNVQGLEGADGESVQMIGGRSGTGFNRAQQRGRTYKGFVDQLERYEFSDSESRLVDFDSGNFESLVEGQDMLLEEVMDHEELYENYPQLAAYQVAVDDSLDGTETQGYYDDSTKTIFLNPELVLRAMEGRPKVMRSVLLHEIQHAVQAIEGFVPGTNIDGFVPNEVKDNVRTQQTAADVFLRSFNLNEALDTLPEEVRERWDSHRRTVSPAGAEAAKVLFLEGDYLQNSNSRKYQLLGQRWDNLSRRVESARVEYNEALTKAEQLYLRDYGETEARNTQFRIEMTNEERSEQPPESTMQHAPGRIPVERTLDSTPFTGGRNLDRVPQSRSLGMADGSRRVETPEAELSVDERLRRVIDEGVRLQTADIKLAEDLDTRYQQAAVKDGIDSTDPQVHDRIEKLLTNMDNADPKLRKELWNSFSKKYPNLAPVLAEMRRKIDENSRAYVQELVATGRTLTPKQIKSIQTLMANEGKYLTRAYSAFQRGFGDKWRKQRWKDWESTQPLSGMRSVLSRLSIPTNRRSQRIAHNAQAVESAIKHLERHFNIPSNDVMQRMEMSALEDMLYDHVGIPANQLQPGTPDERRAEMIRRLDEARNDLTDEIRREMAVNAAKEILGLQDSTSSVSRMFSDLARDPGTLKERQNIAPEIRNLLGEIKDPAGRILSTLSSQAALIARARTMANLLNNYNGVLVLPHNRINEPGMRQQFPYRLQGEEYGPLNGMWATRRVYNSLTDMVDAYFTWQQARELMFRNPEIITRKVLDSALSGVAAPITRKGKLATVVLRPENWLGNQIGSWITLLQAGNFSPSAVRKGFRTSADYVRSAATKTTTELLQDAVEFVGIEAVDVAEMQRVLGDKIKNYIDGKENASDMFRYIKDTVNPEGTEAGKVVLAAYAMQDNWAKIANYHDRYQTLKATYEALGDTRSDRDIKREAGNDTSFTNFSVERVPALIRRLENKGLSAFFPYFSEVFRTRLSNYTLAFADLQRAAKIEKMDTPGAEEAASILRNAATRRFIGNTLVTFALPAPGPMVAYYAMKALGMPSLLTLVAGGDDEDAEKKRRMISEFYRVEDMVPIGKDKEGNAIMYPLSFNVDPNGPMTNLIRGIVNAPTAEEALENVKTTFADLWVMPGWQKRLYRAFTDDDISATDSRTGRIFPEASAEIRGAAASLGLNPDTVNRGLYLVDPFLPGMVSSHDPRQVAKPVEPDAQKMAEVMKWIGANAETIRPASVLRGYAMKSDETRKAVRAQFNNELLYNPKVDDTIWGNAIIRYTTAIKDQNEDDLKNIDSLRAWNYSNDQIREFLTNAGYPKKAISGMMKGEMDVAVSVKSLEETARRAMANAITSEERDNIKDRLKEAKKLIQSKRKELQEMGVDVE